MGLAEPSSTGTLEQWPDGRTDQQAEDAKAGMYGRAGLKLLRARMMPLQRESLHRE